MALVSAAIASLISLLGLSSSEHICGDLAGLVFFALVAESWPPDELREPRQEPPGPSLAFLGRVPYLPILLECVHAVEKEEELRVRQVQGILLLAR